ncbi:hypothetical protein [Chishuiella sp.]|uniref:hypothetical protein n=1 Tax=Chishuiella sp. TaxID=1969467 RepID=UPI0028AF7AD9|nr:hypothetical protein [Chishuiella sp.]
MGMIKKYIISKLKEIIDEYPYLDLKFGKSDFFHNYTIFISDSSVYNSEVFMNYEGEMIIEFISKFNSDYSLFFTDDINFFKVDKVEFENKKNTLEYSEDYKRYDFNDIFFKSYKKYQPNQPNLKFHVINSVLLSKNNKSFSEIISKYNSNNIFNEFKNKNIQELLKSHNPINTVSIEISVTAGNEEYALAA